VDEEDGDERNGTYGERLAAGYGGSPDDGPDGDCGGEVDGCPLGQVRRGLTRKPPKATRYMSAALAATVPSVCQLPVSHAIVSPLVCGYGW